MHTRGGNAVTTQSGVAVTPLVCIIFLIIQWPEVNYSACTTVTTPQNIVQVMHIKTFVKFLSLKG